MIIKRPYLQLERGEKVVLFLRRHPFIFFKHSSFYLLLAIIPPILYFFMQKFDILIWQNPVLYPFVVLGLSSYYLLVWLLFCYGWIDYYLDTWIVTNRRIIDIKQKGFFNRVIAKQDLSRVQDITSEVKGTLATFLNFGNVYVQTAGAKERFIFEEISNPYEIARKINQLVRHTVGTKNGRV